MFSSDLMDDGMAEVEDVDAIGDQEFEGPEHTEDDSANSYGEQLNEIESSSQMDLGEGSPHVGRADLDEDSLWGTVIVGSSSVEPGIEYDSDPELHTEQFELTEAVAQCRHEKENLVVESKSVSAQFQRLEVLLRAAQAKELAAEKEAQEQEENRERELDSLAAEAMEVERLMVETTSDAPCITPVENRHDEEDLEAISVGDQERELESSTLPEPEAMPVPEAMPPLSACDTEDRIPEMEQESDVEVIDESDDDNNVHEGGSTSGSRFENEDCRSHAIEQQYETRDECVGAVSADAIPEDTAAILQMRTDYLMLLERAASQRRELNETLAEIKRLEALLGLATDATVSTAQRTQQNAVPTKRRTPVDTSDVSSPRPLKYLCSSEGA